MSRFPIGDESSNRDDRDLDLVGLQRHHRVAPPEQTPPPQHKGLPWYEFLFYIVIIVGLWIVGQFTPAIPDETFGDILVLAIALLRQRYLLNQ
jgi:hypothetical protein